MEKVFGPTFAVVVMTMWTISMFADIASGFSVPGYVHGLMMMVGVYSTSVTVMKRGSDWEIRKGRDDDRREDDQA